MVSFAIMRKCFSLTERPLPNEVEVSGVHLLHMANSSAHSGAVRLPAARQQIDLKRSVVSGTESYTDLLQEVANLHEQARQQNLALAVATHDMKSPLAVVSGYLKLFATGKLGLLTDAQRQVLDDMQTSCLRLHQLISELLSYTVLKADSRRLHLETGDLNACLEEVCRGWAPSYEAKQVALEFVPANDWPLFPFDFSRLQQVIACLLDNALKFTASGKAVRLTAERHFWERRRVSQSAAPERRKRSSLAPNSVLISVIDSGPGIASEHQQEIFEDFYTLGCGEVRSGTGLGLAIARRVVQAHGGNIWVESRMGAGSTFRLLLPLQPPSNSCSSVFPEDFGAEAYGSVNGARSRAVKPRRTAGAHTSHEGRER